MKVDYVKKAMNAHNNKYLYDLWPKNVKYNTKVVSICHIHGKTKPQTVGSHISGHGCQQCGVIARKNSQEIGTVNYVKRANIVHNNKYDYSLIPEDIKATSSVSIICPTHGSFTQRITDRVNLKQGCSKCAIRNRTKKMLKSVDEWIVNANNIMWVWDSGKLRYTLRNNLNG